MASRIALVTGGNRGLGLETARQLAAGAHVILTSRRESEGYAAAQELVAEGLTVSFRPLDVAGRESVDALAAGLREDRVTLDVLINNAAVALKGFNADVARRTLAVNYDGVARTTDALLPHIADGGNIVMVSSRLGSIAAYDEGLKRRLLDPALTRRELDELAQSFVRDVEHGAHAERGWPASAYNVSKCLLNALARVYARDLAPRRIRVNAICPGWARTDMGGASAPVTVEAGAAAVVWAAQLGADGPNGRFLRDQAVIPW
jgi:carbonyl reductase 1